MTIQFNRVKSRWPRRECLTSCTVWANWRSKWRSPINRQSNRLQVPNNKRHMRRLFSRRGRRDLIRWPADWPACVEPCWKRAFTRRPKHLSPHLIDRWKSSASRLRLKLSRQSRRLKLSTWLRHQHQKCNRRRRRRRRGSWTKPRMPCSEPGSTRCQMGKSLPNTVASTIFYFAFSSMWIYRSVSPFHLPTSTSNRVGLLCVDIDFRSTFSARRPHPRRWPTRSCKRWRRPATTRTPPTRNTSAPCFRCSWPRHGRALCATGKRKPPVAGSTGKKPPFHARSSQSNASTTPSTRLLAGYLLAAISEYIRARTTSSSCRWAAVAISSVRCTVSSIGSIDRSNFRIWRRVRRVSWPPWSINIAAFAIATRSSCSSRAEAVAPSTHSVASIIKFVFCFCGLKVRFKIPWSFFTFIVFFIQGRV